MRGLVVALARQRVNDELQRNPRCRSMGSSVYRCGYIWGVVGKWLRKEYEELVVI